MAADLNSIVLTGTAIKVDRKDLDGGTKKGSIWLEVEGREGKSKPRFTVVGLGDTADAILEVQPGGRVIVQGFLSQRNFKDKADKWQSFVEVFATKVVRIGGEEGADDAPADNGGYDDDIPF